jgi:hypothetical protein
MYVPPVQTTGPSGAIRETSKPDNDRAARKLAEPFGRAFRRIGLIDIRSTRDDYKTEFNSKGGGVSRGLRGKRQCIERKHIGSATFDREKKA